jgi:hypothetical protein
MNYKNPGSMAFPSKREPADESAFLFDHCEPELVLTDKKTPVCHMGRPGFLV